MISPLIASSSTLGPTGLWQHLGDTPGKPWLPMRWQAEAYDLIEVPWPGVLDGVPYPTIIAVNTGRRAGKTTFMEKLIWKGALAPDDTFGPPTIRITADTEEHGFKSWDRFIWHLDNTPLAALKKSHSRERNLVTFHNDATIQLISANNPAALAGDGVTLWLIDEAQYISQAAWDNLFPSTAERNGVIVAFGVSEGEGPFRDICLRGDDKNYPEYRRLAYPTAANPFVPKWRIDFAQRTLLPHKFKQLYLAQWEGELGKIFRNVDGCKNEKEVFQAPEGYYYTEPYKPGHDYYVGLDLGRLSDWSVITIWTRDGELIAWDRFNIIDWELQKARFKLILRCYSRDRDIDHSPAVCVDATGIGDPIHDDLVGIGIRVREAFSITTNARKRLLIDEFAIRVGSGDVSYPNIPIFLEELQHYEARKSKKEGSPIVLYEAPSGKHDDFVLSAAFAARIVPRKAHHLPGNVISDPDDPFFARQVGAWEAIS